MANGLSFIAVHLISIVINCKSEPDGNLQRDATMNCTLHIAAVGGAVAAHFALDPALAVPKLFAGSSNGNMSGLIRG